MNLKLKNVSKKFKDIEVLKDVNINFSSGKIYGLIGRNGSGKSVLLKLICGFYIPTSGEIELDGYNYIANNDFPKDTRALIEKPNFLPDLTGLENLKLLASIQNKVKTEDIINMMKKLHLEDEMNKKYSKYSLGTKQKLGIAQVLMENPKLIILDEPFNGVEDETVNEIRNILLKEKKKDKIIIIASHMKDDIEILADEVYKINDGTIKLVKD